MKPPDGVTIRHTSTSNGHAHYEVTIEEVVHRCPPMGSGVTPCCGRTPFELPRFDRITLDPKLVTCKARTTSPSAASSSSPRGTAPGGEG